MVRHCLQEQRVFLDASDCPWCLCIKKQIQQHVTCLAMLPGNLTCGPSTGQSQQRRSQPAWSTEDEDRSELLGFPIHACVHLYSVVCPSTINVVCSSIIDFRAQSFSCVQLFVTQGLQPTRLLCPQIFQARILERVAISFSRASSQPMGQTRFSCIAGRFFTI